MPKFRVVFICLSIALFMVPFWIGLSASAEPAIRTAAEKAIRFNPESLSFDARMWFVLYAVGGWAAAELDSLAEFLTTGQMRAKLSVVKRFIQCVASGGLVGIVVLTQYPDTPMIYAYGTTFAAAYKGADILLAVATAVSTWVVAGIKRITGEKSDPHPPA